MRILAIGINYWPEETGIAVFNTGWCEYLAAAGYEVTVCTGFPYYPDWRVTEGYRGRVFGSETRNGVRVLRSYLYVPRRITTARRVVHEGTFVASSCLRAMANRRPDLLFTLSPPLGLGLSSALLGLLWGIPYILHVLDLQPDAALELGMLRRGPATEALYAVERLAYRRAALVATLTEPMRTRIVAKGVPAAKVVVFPSWADPSLFRIPPAGADGRFREATGLNGEFLVVHIGNMGVKQGLEVLIETATLSRDDRGIAYLLVGDGAMREHLKQEASVRGLKNLHFLPLQPRAAFLELLAEADISVVTQQRAVTDIVFPSKLVTLLAAGRPVVASVNREGEVARVIERSGAGLVVPPEDPKALFEAIRVLRAAGPLGRVMGERGRAYAAARWSAAHVLPEMEARLLSLTGDGKLAGTQ